MVNILINSTWSAEAVCSMTCWTCFNSALITLITHLIGFHGRCDVGFVLRCCSVRFGHMVGWEGHCARDTNFHSCDKHAHARLQSLKSLNCSGRVYFCWHEISKTTHNKSFSFRLLLSTWALARKITKSVALRSNLFNNPALIQLTSPLAEIMKAPALLIVSIFPPAVAVRSQQGNLITRAWKNHQRRESGWNFRWGDAARARASRDVKHISLFLACARAPSAEKNY